MGIEGLAWFFMSEGSAGITVSPDRKKQKANQIGYRAYPNATFSNTDIIMLTAISNSLNQRGITNKIRPTSKGYVIKINCLKVKKFLSIVSRYLIGDKKTIAELIKEYYTSVWVPMGVQNRYKPSKYRFLRTIEIHDKICEINETNHRKKYDVKFFLDRFGFSSLEEAKQKSPEPANRYTRIQKICEFCDKQYLAKAYRSDTSRFCSVECRKQSGKYILPWKSQTTSA